ncbi:MAG: hypothetical protein NTV86_22460 [Planctomycetota bacterium]|nr:hypothetical protein [Planctomycetota bacterium]
MRANTKQRLVAALGFVLCGLSVPVAADGQVDEAKVTVWSGAMVLDKNYEVPEGYTLRIEPGTVIETGKGGWVKLEVKGTLEAVGTKDKPIEFRATRSHSWAGIHFAGPGAGGRVEPRPSSGMSDWSTLPSTKAGSSARRGLARSSRAVRFQAPGWR